MHSSQLPSADPKPFKAKLRIKLDDAFHADVLKSVLEVDEELQPQRLSRIITTEEVFLVVAFEAIDLKMLRVGISSFVDMATVSAKTMLEFS